jgi:hypothetical protein
MLELELELVLVLVLVMVYIMKLRKALLVPQVWLLRLPLSESEID